jgi:hypothetical protein
MRTYLKIQFHSEGELPSKIIRDLEMLGWKPVIGEYDFVLEGGFGEGVGTSFLKRIDELQ